MMGFYAGTPTATMPVSASQAQADAQQYLNAYYPGTTAGEVYPKIFCHPSTVKEVGLFLLSCQSNSKSFSPYKKFGEIMFFADMRGTEVVYDQKIREVSSKGSLAYFLTPKPKIPQLTVGASMADVVGTMSENVDFKAGIDLLGNFLEAFKFGSIISKVKFSYEAKNAKTIRFKFPNTTKDSVDAMQLGNGLKNKKPIQKHLFYNENNQYFLVIAVARTSSITVAVQNTSNKQVLINAKAIIAKIAGANADIEKGADRSTTFHGKKKLAFAVELKELVYDQEEDRILLKPTKQT